MWIRVYFLGYISFLSLVLPDFQNRTIQFTEVILVTKDTALKILEGCVLSAESPHRAHRASVDLKVNSGCGVGITALEKKKNNFQAKGPFFSLGVIFLESLFIDFPGNN